MPEGEIENGLLMSYSLMVDKSQAMLTQGVCKVTLKAIIQRGVEILIDTHSWVSDDAKALQAVDRVRHFMSEILDDISTRLVRR
jgi:hypothetical protein